MADVFLLFSIIDNSFTGTSLWVIRRVFYKKQGLLTLRDYMGSSPFCVMFVLLIFLVFCYCCFFPSFCMLYSLFPVCMDCQFFRLVATCGFLHYFSTEVAISIAYSKVWFINVAYKQSTKVIIYGRFIARFGFKTTVLQ